MKYIFVTGAPGSKWSSVVKNIYYSPSIDNSDYNISRTYYHDAGDAQLVHLGSYFDPGMEFDLPENFAKLSKDELESIFDSAFTGNGIRIIKSHIFSNNIDFIKNIFPEVPIVLVYRNNNDCFDWWCRCGNFDIKYPNYRPYYKNLEVMITKIKEQNQGILEAIDNYPNKVQSTNHMLCTTLNIELPPNEHYQDYEISGIKVTVI
jgi:hypothetical protein